MKAKELVGSKFGRLTVMSRITGSKKRRVRWECRCECGGNKEVSTCHLTGGLIRSCGCLRAETAAAQGGSNRTHGLIHSREYHSWQQMKSRCNNPRSQAYPDYGGRGISVCDRWHDFAAFYEDMGPCPEGLTIDRYPDNDGNYEPGNCRWADMKQQSRNRRTNKLVTHDGVTKTIAEWAESADLNYDLLRNRFCMGWSLNRAVTTPGGKWKARRRIRCKRVPEAVVLEEANGLSPSERGSGGFGSTGR